METDFAIKALFTFVVAIYLLRCAIRSYGIYRFIWAFVAVAPSWAFCVYAGVIMGVIETYEYVRALQPVVLLTYTAPVIVAWLPKES